MFIVLREGQKMTKRILIVTKTCSFEGTYRHDRVGVSFFVKRHAFNGYSKPLILCPSSDDILRLNRKW